jgi:hypothetical protein
MSQEALANGQIRVIPCLQDLEEADEIEDEEAAENVIATHAFLNNLPLVDQCNVCYEVMRPGFILACEHCLCKQAY